MPFYEPARWATWASSSLAWSSKMRSNLGSSFFRIEPLAVWVDETNWSGPTEGQICHSIQPVQYNVHTDAVAFLSHVLVFSLSLLPNNLKKKKRKEKAVAKRRNSCTIPFALSWLKFWIFLFILHGRNRIWWCLRIISFSPSILDC